MLPSSYRCRSCKCSALCRIKRKKFDYLFSLIGLRPVRCLTCGRKSYKRIAEKDLNPPTRVTPTAKPATPRDTPLRKPAGPRRVA